jgi:hypothetical protein
VLTETSGGKLLTGHEVKTARQMNWDGLSNGNLLAAANPHFDAFITVDNNLVHEQKIEGLRLAVAVLRARSNKLEDLSSHVPELLATLPLLKPGQVAVIGD